MEKHYFDIREILETVKTVIVGVKLIVHTHCYITSINLLLLFTCLKYFPIAVLIIDGRCSFTSDQTIASLSNKLQCSMERYIFSSLTTLF